MVNTFYLYRIRKILPIILFFLLFGPKLFGTIFDLITVASIITIIIGANLRINTYSATVTIFFLIAFTQCIYIISGIVAGGDIQHLLRAVRIMINSLGIYILVLLYIRYYNGFAKDVFVYHIFICFIIHSVIMIFQYNSKIFLELSYFITNPYGIVNVDISISSGKRILGLTYGLASTSVLQLYGIFAYLYICDSRSKISLWTHVGALLILLSIILSGRSGILIGAILIPIYLIMQGSLSIMRVCMYGLIIGLFIWIVKDYLPIYCSTNYCSEYLRYRIWHLEELGDLLKGENSRTISHLSNKIVFPQNFLVWVIGGEDAGHDSGYIRDIFSGGIGFMILSLLIYLIPIALAILKMKLTKFIVLVNIIFISAIIFHAKEVCFFVRGFWTVHLAMIIFLIYCNKVQFSILRRNQKTFAT
jgi:hypothetical protein